MDWLPMFMLFMQFEYIWKYFCGFVRPFFIWIYFVVLILFYLDTAHLCCLSCLCSNGSNFIKICSLLHLSAFKPKLRVIPDFLDISTWCELTKRFCIKVFRFDWKKIYEHHLNIVIVTFICRQQAGAVECVSDVWLTALQVSQVSQKDCRQSGQYSWICRTRSCPSAPGMDGALPVWITWHQITWANIANMDVEGLTMWCASLGEAFYTRTFTLVITTFQPWRADSEHNFLFLFFHLFFLFIFYIDVLNKGKMKFDCAGYEAGHRFLRTTYILLAQ